MEKSTGKMWLRLQLIHDISATQHYKSDIFCDKAVFLSLQIIPPENWFANNSELIMAA
jgi:hypothetical protein